MTATTTSAASGWAAVKMKSYPPMWQVNKGAATTGNKNPRNRRNPAAKVAIATGASRVLALPSTSVHREQNQPFVLIQKGKDEYERRPVKVGEDVNGSVEVLGGVGPTDRVVTTGSILLKRSVK